MKSSIERLRNSWNVYPYHDKRKGLVSAEDMYIVENIRDYWNVP